MSAADAVKLVKSYDKVYIQGSTSIPEVLCQALADRHEELRGVEVYSAFGVARGVAPYSVPEYRDSFIVKSLFIANSVRDSIARGDPNFTGGLTPFRPQSGFQEVPVATRKESGVLLPFDMRPDFLGESGMQT